MAALKWKMAASLIRSSTRSLSLVSVPQNRSEDSTSRPATPVAMSDSYELSSRELLQTYDGVPPETGELIFA